TSITPAVPTPSPRRRATCPARTGTAATTSRTRPATASSTASGPAGPGVGTVRTRPRAPSGPTVAAAVFVPPRSTPTTTSVTQEPCGTRDLLDAGRDVGVERLDRERERRRVDEPLRARRDLERPDARGVARAALRLEHDLEERRDAVLLELRVVPLAGLGEVPQAHVAARVDVREARDDAVGAEQQHPVHDDLVPREQRERRARGRVRGDEAA